MILYDPALTVNFRDYGIMLPISPDRAGRVVESLRGKAGGAFSGFPGPVLDLPGALGLRAMQELEGRVSPDRRDLERVHQGEFIAGLYGEGLQAALLNAYELIDSQGRPHRYEPERAIKPLTFLFETILNQVGGTYLACRLAMVQPEPAGTPGFCYYLGGGMHHARYDTGAGFCLVNDLVIAARKLQAEGLARLIWIVDVDAHKGCGTAELVSFSRAQPPGLLANKTGTDILTLSVHMAAGWPLDEETLKTALPGRAPLLPSDVEIPLEAGQETAYVPELEKGLYKLEAISHGQKPDLAIVVDGADPYEHDGLPSSALLKLTLDQCAARDWLIYTFLRTRSIPSAWIMAGGYGDRAWEPTASFLSSLST
ncbi:MAG: histone deacetylase [Spirochaetaceae bacterium]|jgi:acetoin utilization deacetylase AcuC-like enzyme|nr:histone deacetylase [Spirochaetaceae bacterium]